MSWPKYVPVSGISSMMVHLHYATTFLVFTSSSAYVVACFEIYTRCISGRLVLVHIIIVPLILLRLIMQRPKEGLVDLDDSLNYLTKHCRADNARS